jgi:signal transduction histidine kinase
MDGWKASVRGVKATFEMRWKKKRTDKPTGHDDTRDYVWTLSNCTPIKSEEGIVTGICGCNTDISAQKEAERAAILRMKAERRLANFTELAPVGFYQLDAHLGIEYCNDQWFKITNHPKVPVKEIDWRSLIVEEDLEGILQEMKTILQQGGSHTFSFRIKRLWRGPDGILTPTWLLATACTSHDKEGNITSFMGTMNDVSHLKWAEAVQRSRVEEALESKRQQENFIDMTSHEMRNPLSAMVQCADTISSSLGEMAVLADETVASSGQESSRALLKDLVNTSLEAVETIQACATHQKRIVDDILTLSKLDSKLLVISPMVTQPAVLLQDVYKMFKEEAAKARVALDVRCDDSIAEMNISHAMLDPSRVLQVLINLLTNAIKFTQDQPVRKVDIVMSASTDVAQRPEIEYVPQEESRKSMPNESKADDEDAFYLHFTVKDTGCGLSAEHKAKLFLRFSQASPKTHVQVRTVCSVLLDS